MANPLGVWELATGAIAGLAIGQALSDAVAPTFEVLTQTSWHNKPVRVLDPATAAEVDAEGIVTKVDTADDAQRGGIGPARYSLLQELALQGIGFADALTLWRRGEIEKPDVAHALRKAKVEPRWDSHLYTLFTDRLDPASIANGIQQGYLHNPDVLPVSPSTDPGKVRTMGPQDIDVLAEAQAQGLDLPRLRVLAGLAGLPPGPETLLTMLRRNLIEIPDVERGIAQGHTKTEYTDAYLSLVAEVLPPTTVTMLRLRGQITAEQSYELGALNGYGPVEMDRFYLAAGRPAAPGQMATAVARGFATEADFDEAIVRSDIRPEYADLLYKIRFNYPPLFQVSRLVAAGEVDDATATEWLTFDRYAPDVAAKIVAGSHKAKVAHVKDLTRSDVLTYYAARYIDAATATTDLANLGYTPEEIALLLEHADAQRVLRFLNAAVGKVHSQYVGWRIDRNQAEGLVGLLGIGGHARDDMLGLWDIEREANAPHLPAASILTLLHAGKITSGAAYASLISRGYTDPAARAEVSRYAAFGADGALAAPLETPL